MKIIEKTIKKAYNHWNPNSLIRCYHYCAAFEGKKMIGFAQNNPIKMTRKAHRIGQQFNIPTYVEYSYPHAESLLVAKLLGRYNYVDPSWKFVVMRINRVGKILLSKPCENCQKILDALNIDNFYYSNDDGDFISNDGSICRSKTSKIDLILA